MKRKVRTEVTQVSPSLVYDALLKGLADGHPAPFEPLFPNRRTAFRATVAGFSAYNKTLKALASTEGSDLISAVLYLDPAPEAVCLEVAAVRIVGIYTKGEDATRAYYLVKTLDTLATRLRQREREYLIVEISPADDFLVHVLEGSGFLLVGADDILCSGKVKTDKAVYNLEPAEPGAALEEFVSEGGPPAPDPYLGDFAVRAWRRRFQDAARDGRAFFAYCCEERVGVLIIEKLPGLPDGAAAVVQAYPWDKAEVYEAAANAGTEKLVVRAPLSALALRSRLAEVGFRCCDVRLTYRLLL